MAVEGVSDDEAVEGARAGGEAGGDHVVDDVADADGVAVPGAAHELLHKGEAEALLGRAGGVIVLGLTPLPSGSLLRRRGCRCANDDDGGVLGFGTEGEGSEAGGEGVGGEEESGGGHWRSG